MILRKNSQRNTYYVPQNKTLGYAYTLFAEERKIYKEKPLTTTKQGFEELTK